MWNLRPDERLREWRNFRQMLATKPIEQACHETSHLWSYAPFVSHYLDSDKNNSIIAWPDPWTLLHENVYCDVAKSLGMLYTLYLSDHRPPDIELRIYRQNDSREMFNLVWLSQGKYILNLSYDEVVNKEHLKIDLHLIYRYTAGDLGLDLY